MRAVGSAASAARLLLAEPELCAGLINDCGRICGQGMNYGRLVTTNASVLTYEHVENANGRVTDSWSIIKT